MNLSYYSIEIQLIILKYTPMGYELGNVEKRSLLTINDLWLSAKLSGSNIHNYFEIHKCHIAIYLYIVQGASFYIETLALCTKVRITEPKNQRYSLLIEF